MSKALAVAARELRERWLLFPGGLALGCVPLILPAFGLPEDASPTLGLFVALLLGAISALVIGSSMLARDASDGRLGFLFSRPVPWGAIWGGKWLAAIVLVTGSGALAALPWMLVYPPSPDAHARSWVEALLDVQGTAFFVLLVLLAVGLTNFGATAFRSRSAWVALDIALLLVASWLAWRWVAPLYSLGLFWHNDRPLAGWILLLPWVPVPTALVVASAAQAARGRTDIRRAHRAMSVAFWAVVFLALGAAGLRLAWARSAPPTDLVAQSGSHSSSGRWLNVTGRSSRGGWMTFLLDTETGRYLSMGLDRPFQSLGLGGMAFAARAETGAGLIEHGDGSALHVADLTGDEPRFSVVALESSPPPTFGMRLALSPSGETALLTHEHGASLFSVESGRRVATATIAPGWRAASTRFFGPASARVFLIPDIGRHASLPRAEMRILDVVVGREARTATVALAAPLDPVRAWPAFARPNASGARFLTLDDGVRLRDGETGTLLATLVEGAGTYQTAFAADGRIVVGEGLGARVVLHVFAPDGTALGDITLERASAGLGVGPEVAPGHVAVHCGGLTDDYETVVVDLSEGRVTESLPDLRPRRAYWMLDSPLVGPGDDVFTVHFLFRAKDGAVVRRDFATGEERVVAGAGAPVGKRLKRP